jgi:biopolymer transport protein ExbD
MGIKLSHADEGLAETHEINVTPFIDVMLVLMIIFMLTVPLSTVDVPVHLPVADTDSRPDNPDPIFVTLQADLSVSVGDNRVNRADLGSVLQQATKGDRETPLYLRADQTVSYGKLMDLLNVLRSTGYLKVALVALQNEDDSP